MSIQFGDTRIGEMRYNGANIVEAMYDGQIVWQSAMPPPRYTWTGTGSSSTPARNVWTQVVSHTIPAGGSNGEYVADIIPYVQWRTPATNTTYQLRLLRNSVVIETKTGYLDVFGSKYTSFTLSDQQVFAGQTYSVEILSGSYSSAGRGVMSTSLKFV